MPVARTNTAPVTKNLITACVAVYLVQLLVGPRVEFQFGLSMRGLQAGAYWQLLTYQFLHGGELHLIVNMVALWFAGRELEYLLGAEKYMILYFAGGIVGGLAQVFLYPSGMPLVGASASVCAVLLCLTTLLPNVPLTALIFFVLPVRLRARTLGYALVGITGLMWIFNFPRNVGHAAHFGGLAVGWVLGILFRWQMRRAGEAVQMAPAAASFWSDEEPVAEDGNFEVVDAGSEAATLDEVLEKLRRSGIDSLSRKELKILEKSRPPRG